MIYSVDNVTLTLAIFLLLALSILTVQYCRQDRSKEIATERSYLFEGKTKLHSYASNLGSVFSVTYFFGATIIYSNIFKSWLILLFLAVVVISLIILQKVIIHADKSLAPSQSRGKSNVILELLSASLDESSYSQLMTLYTLIYLGLLIEEIAVSRLLLVTLLPNSPVATALILATIIFCVSGYIYAGGFRALLNSDLVQLLIISPFLVLLLFFSRRGSELDDIVSFRVKMSGLLLGSGLVFALLFGVAWFISSIDLYSRLNFTTIDSSLYLRQRIVVIRVTFFSLFIILGIGSVFGVHFNVEMPLIPSPVDYFNHATTYFLSESPLVVIIFILTLYSMMFTTIDTLLFTLFQIGWYRKYSPLSRSNVLKIFGVCVIVAIIPDLNSLGAIGIYLGSLMVIPGVIIVQETLLKNLRLLPKRASFITWSLVLSIMLFSVLFDELRLPFERHFLIPGIVLFSVASTVVVARMLERRRRA